jgi:hypothetical protein
MSLATTSAADIISVIAAAENANQSFIVGRNPLLRHGLLATEGLDPSRFQVRSHPMLLAKSLQPLMPLAVNPAAI